MTSVLITAALAAALRSLWICRDTWRSGWDYAASLSVALHACALILMSPWASTTFGTHLHEALGVWNVQALLGHVFLVGAAVAFVRHVLVRFGDDARELFARHIIQPINIGVAALVVLFVVADTSYQPDLFAAHATGWLGTYWLALGALLCYLFGYAGRLLLMLRTDARSKPTADVYLTALALATTAGFTQVVTAWAGIDVALPVWLFGCLSLVGFAWACAQSWRAKINWFVSGYRPPAPHPWG